MCEIAGRDPGIRMMMPIPIKSNITALLIRTIRSMRLECAWFLPVPSSIFGVMTPMIRSIASRCRIPEAPPIVWMIGDPEIFSNEWVQVFELPEWSISQSVSYQRKQILSWPADIMQVSSWMAGVNDRLTDRLIYIRQRFLKYRKKSHVKNHMFKSHKVKSFLHPIF